MTSRTELLELINNGENSGVEFKRDDIDNRQLARELVAFSNFEGGSALLGVEDDGSISGIVRDDVEEWVMGACRDKIRPPLIPYFEIIRDVEPGRNIAVVRVSRGLDVSALYHNQRNSYYIRVGSTVREPSPEELARLFQQRGSIRAEMRPVSGSTIEDLDRRRLRDYFVRVREQDVPADDDTREWETLLTNTDLMSDGSVTVGGLLLFGPNPNRFLPQSGIDAAAYPNTTKDYATLQRANLRGPLTPLFGRDGLVENGLIDQVIEFVRANTGVTVELEGGARRLDIPEYPQEAVRETVVNAAIHRDYLLSHTNIELSLYSDRLEVISPGRLLNGVTPERMRAGCRVARNQLLKDVMRDYRYLEHMGMGVPRKIVLGMKNHNNTEPDMEETDELFTVRLFASAS